MKTHTIICKHCNKQVDMPYYGKKRIQQFCSKSCSALARHKANPRSTMLTTACCICKKEFSRRWYHDKPKPRVCSKRCTGKLSALARGGTLIETVKSTCKACAKQFVHQQKASRAQRLFCSTSCRSKYATLASMNASAGYDKLYEHWVQKFGIKIANEKIAKFKQNKSIAFAGKNNPVFGKAVPKDRVKKISAGIKLAYKKGRLTPPLSTRFVAGTYKGVTFRSSYEYLFLKKLESEGINIQRDVVVEPHEFRTQYIDPTTGKQHTYIPDYFVPSRNVLYEIKSEHLLDDPVTIEKKNAILNAGYHVAYKLLTLSDITRSGCIAREDIQQDEYVQLYGE